MEGYGTYGIKTIWIDAAEPEHFGASQEGQWKMMGGTDAEIGESYTFFLLGSTCLQFAVLSVIG
jgi:hypothetical protein